VSRPTIALLGAGGTIAMTGPGDQATYAALGAADLKSLTAEVDIGAELLAHDVLNRPSASFTLTDVGLIAAAIDAATAFADGIVVTQGTDTLEETAFALSLLVHTEVPVVLTGAMRRHDQPGADGPANFVAAARVAASHAAAGLGVLVVFDDEIHAAPLVRKVHSFRTHAFSSAPFGPIGWVAEDRVRFALAPRLSLPLLTYTAGNPIVPIVEAGPGLEASVVEALAGAVDGLVLSLPGGGHIAAEAVECVSALAADIPIVFASRTGAGETLRHTYGFQGSEMDLIDHGLIPAGPLDGRKARILLQLLLAEGAAFGRVRNTFASL
jgi:L-asparaginase